MFDFVAFVCLVVDEIGAGGLTVVRVEVGCGVGTGLFGVHFWLDLFGLVNYILRFFAQGFGIVDLWKVGIVMIYIVQW